MYLSMLPSYKITRKHFDEDLPDFDTLRSKISLILTNGHPAVGTPRALTPGSTELSGIHIQSAAPVALPKDLQDFLDWQSKDGVIYFSPESQVNSSTLLKQVLAGFYRALEQVPQQILWKCSREKMAELPRNVKCIEWAPQLSILCHPNVRMLITHDRLLVTQAAVYTVPILAIPLFEDQHLNVAYFVKKGLALQLKYHQLSYEPVSNTLDRLLTDNRLMLDLEYQNMSKEFISPEWAFHYMRHEYLPIQANDCSYVWNIPAEDRCQWVKETADCTSDSILQYTKILFCTFHTDSTFLLSLGLFLMILWLLYMFLILATTADNFFCPSLTVIADVFQLSETIAGVTVLAFGNGAPDIFTSLVSGTEEGIIMFTELLGAALFVTAIIAGSVAIVRPFRVHLKLLMRDACFYIFVVCWIGYVVRDGKIYLWEALSFILCYLLFITIVLTMQLYESREEKLKTRIPSASDPEILRTYLENKDTATIPKIPVRARAAGLRTKLDIAIAAEMDRLRLLHGIPKSKPEQTIETEGETSDRPKGLFKEFFYDINPIGRDDWMNSGLFGKCILIVQSPVLVLLRLYIPIVNTTCEKRGWSKLLNCFQLCVTPTVALFLLNVWKTQFGPVSIVPIFLLLGAVIAVIVFLITHVDHEPRFHNAFAFLGFLTAMTAVYLVAGEVVAILLCVGHAFSISDAMLGITFLAWGNSVGDLISNVAIAKQGFPRMGYAACFGGPMFNTLLGLGLTYAIAASERPAKCTHMRMSDMAPGCMAFLLCSLLTTIVYVNISGAIARKSYGYLLYSLYFTFMLIQFLSEFAVIHPLGTDHRPDPPIAHDDC